MQPSSRGDPWQAQQSRWVSQPFTLAAKAG
jgi:hypothetical protein